jgi:hypothetical protein
MQQQQLDQLQSIAGVRPSQQFWQACTNALAAVSHATRVDAVLEQILHHDLRNVVRSNSATTNTVPPESLALRRAIRDSTTASKATLPATFRLLVQVEEVVNVSQKSSTGAANNSSTGANGDCYKLFLCDGYNLLNENNHHEQNTTAIIVAMMTASRPLVAGSKLLLQGPYTLRHGILLFPCPPICLGGAVPELEARQKRALKQAQRAATVDPTILALIGTGGDDENQQDGMYRISVSH